MNHGKVHFNISRFQHFNIATFQRFNISRFQDFKISKTDRAKRAGRNGPGETDRAKRTAGETDRGRECKGRGERGEKRDEREMASIPFHIFPYAPYTSIHHHIPSHIQDQKYDGQLELQKWPQLGLQSVSQSENFTYAHPRIRVLSTPTMSPTIHPFCTLRTPSEKTK